MKYLLVLTLLYFAFPAVSQLNSVMSLSTSLGVNKSTLSNPNSRILGSNINYKPKVLDLSLAGPLDVYELNTSKFNSKKNWTLNKKELRFSFGLTQFLGDLGGDDAAGTDYSLKDYDKQAMSFSGMIGYRYRFANFFATTTSLSVGMLKGSDEWVDEGNSIGQFRKIRNLNFRSPFIDLSQRIDIMLYMYEKVGKRYSIRGIKGFNNRNEQVYIFGGIGVLGFMPQGQLDGRWYNLKPLSTEGQGLVGGPAKYSGFALTAPMGFGFRVGISREWRFGVEASYTKVFSDYVDDVAGVYYDKGMIASQKGEIAAAISDKSFEGVKGYEAGMQRGDKQNDSYYYINFVLTRNVTYRNYTKTYKRYKLPKSKYKF